MVTKIEVTRDDIQSGIPRDGQYCPVARAVCRQFGLVPDEVSVDDNGLDFFTERDRPLYHVWETVPLPPEASDFIERFDKGRSVTPFEFEVDLDVEP